MADTSGKSPGNGERFESANSAIACSLACRAKRQKALIDKGEADLRAEPAATGADLEYPAKELPSLFGARRQKRCYGKGWLQQFFAHNSSQRWKRVPPVVETGVNTLSVNAGASPAGFSRAVVQPTRTTDPYTLVNCSPCGNLFSNESCSQKFHNGSETALSKNERNYVGKTERNADR